ncbi:MAG: hypothetical protein ACRDBM_01305, partial [Sporomusa sp.]
TIQPLKYTGLVGTAENDKELINFDPVIIKLLENYSLPGDARELGNVNRTSRYCYMDSNKYEKNCSLRKKLLIFQ